MNRLTIAAIATAASVFAVAAPASAQTAQETARFTAAQDRINNEMQLFRQESDRYRAAISRRPSGYQQPYNNDPRYNDPRYDNSGYDNGGYRQADDNYYDPRSDYRTGNYQERTLSADERVYRGTDGKYYCKRNDGTTGLIVGAAGGALLGNVIDGGRSRIVGTLLGGAAGALAGKAIDQGSSSNQIRCR